MYYRACLARRLAVGCTVRARAAYPKRLLPRSWPRPLAVALPAPPLPRSRRLARSQSRIIQSGSRSRVTSTECLTQSSVAARVSLRDFLTYVHFLGVHAPPRRLGRGRATCHTLTYSDVPPPGRNDCGPGGRRDTIPVPSCFPHPRPLPRRGSAARDSAPQGTVGGTRCGPTPGPLGFGRPPPAPVQFSLLPAEMGS
jgi:hypothetical protein